MSSLDTLRQMANHAVITYCGDRRPTWAPPLVLEGELITILQDLRMLGDRPVARLWAQFTSPKYGNIQCVGFELRAGTTRSGKKFYETGVSFSNVDGSVTVQPGTWHHGPRWKSPEEAGGRWVKDPRWIARYPLLVRAAELGGHRVLEFAGAPAEQMQIGGVICGSCAVCGKRLTDAISRERGIGPECWGRFGALLERLRASTGNRARSSERQERTVPMVRDQSQPPYRPVQSPPWGEP